MPVSIQSNKGFHVPPSTNNQIPTFTSDKEVYANHRPYGHVMNQEGERKRVKNKRQKEMSN